jgi:hypothetical protein
VHHLSTGLSECHFLGHPHSRICSCCQGISHNYDQVTLKIRFSLFKNRAASQIPHLSHPDLYEMSPCLRSTPLLCGSVLCRLFSGSLWESLGLKEQYLNAPEVVAAVKAVRRPVQTCLLALVLFALCETSLWMICDTEDFCVLEGSRSLQLGLVSSIVAACLLCSSVVMARIWQPVSVCGLFLPEVAMTATVLLCTASAATELSSAHTGLDTHIRYPVSRSEHLKRKFYHAFVRS